MENNYRQFKMTIYTLGPVHIGSGEKYSSKEFLYEERNGTYYFPDMGKLYHYLISKKLDSRFETFLLKSNRQGLRLNNFFADNKIRERNFGGYTIKETGFEKENSTKGALNDISKFLRDGFGKPYVPGSSLKGAIRTILLNTHWKNQDFKVVRGKKTIENRQVIPWGAKKKQNFDDIFNEIRVSDSQPLSNDNLIIVQKWDHSSKTRQAKPLPLYRESLPPMTSLTFTITTTSDRAYQLISQLGEFANSFYKDYSVFFLKEFPSDNIQNNVQYPIYLGVGSGVWTKTIIHQADGLVQKRYERMKTKMVRKGVMKLTKAPVKGYKTKSGRKTLIKNNQNFYEMGKACFLIKEV